MKLKLVVLALGIVWASQAAADSFNQFISFGDSTADSGWWSGALNGSCDGAPSPCTTGSTTKNTLIQNAINGGGDWRTGWRWIHDEHSDTRSGLWFDRTTSQSAGRYELCDLGSV